MKTIIILLLFVICSPVLYCQVMGDSTIEFKDGDYVFKTKFDTSTYSANLTISKNNNVIFDSGFENEITGITPYDLEGNGRKQYFIDQYTGGAHCCFILFIGEFKNDKFVLSDSVFMGNSGYQVINLDKSKDMEILSTNDAYAYAFTNFAQSFFPIAIYKYENGKLKYSNKDFPEVVEKDIKELKTALKEYTDKGFECPKSADAETFNTDAGAVKAILGPIVEDYYSIGKGSEGFAFVDKVYKCPDKKKFIEILKKDFKLN